MNVPGDASEQFDFHHNRSAHNSGGSGIMATLDFGFRNGFLMKAVHLPNDGNPLSVGVSPLQPKQFSTTKATQIEKEYHNLISA